MSDETKNAKGGGSLFTTENVVMGILLGSMAWGGVQITQVKEVQASLVTQQSENSRVNELVYSAIPQIQVSVATLATNQKNMNDKMDGLIKEVTVVKHGQSNLSTALIDRYGLKGIEEE